jgi:hypothetical protein
MEYLLPHSAIVHLLKKISQQFATPQPKSFMIKLDLDLRKL